jgi:hypothetical protein
MPAIVTLDIYSGRPNPSWVVDDDQLDQVQRRIQQRGAAAAQHPAVPILGYRGFIIRPVQSQDGPVVRLEGVAESAQGAGDAVISGMPEAEHFLLSTAEEAGALHRTIDAELRQYVEESISRGVDPAVLERAAEAAQIQCPKCEAADAPAYDPSFWNGANHVTLNNCYNYANNQRTDTYAQPGRASNKPIPPKDEGDCGAVLASARSDGLHASGNFSTKLGAGKGWYVALVVWPGKDYHWYRQDKVGCWSHKVGGRPAGNKDNSGKAISDPSKCDRGGYTTFCTFMISTKSVRIK